MLGVFEIPRNRARSASCSRPATKRLAGSLFSKARFRLLRGRSTRITISVRTIFAPATIFAWGEPPQTPLFRVVFERGTRLRAFLVSTLQPGDSASSTRATRGCGRHPPLSFLTAAPPPRLSAPMLRKPPMRWIAVFVLVLIHPGLVLAGAALPEILAPVIAATLYLPLWPFAAMGLPFSRTPNPVVGPVRAFLVGSHLSPSGSSSGLWWFQSSFESADKARRRLLGSPNDIYRPIRTGWTDRLLLDSRN